MESEATVTSVVSATGPSAPAPTPAAPEFTRHRWLTAGNIAMVARVVFIIMALVAFGYFARAVVVPVLLACTAAIILAPLVRCLRYCRIPILLASALVVTLFVVGVASAVLHLGRPAVEWLETAPENLPRLRMKFQHLLRPAARLSEAASTVGNLAAGERSQEAQSVQVKDNRVASTFFTWTGTFIAGAGETVGLLFLLLASGDLFLHKLVRLMPRLRDKKQAVEVSRQIQQSISTYLLSVTVINICFGVVVWVALWALGLPNAMMWGGVAAFANFIPYLGPILGMIAVAVAGLLAFDSFGQGLLPVGAYCALHLVEANVVTPLILGRRFALNPVIIFVALIFFTFLWGVIGALLAVPLLVTVKAVCERVPSLARLGELLAPHESLETEREKDNATGTPVAAPDAATPVHGR
jgi:predicted PurR-regulated permease PerM